MATLLKIAGWTLRASAAICMTYIIVSVAQGAENLRTLPQILSSVSYHAAFALVGTQLVGCAKRREARVSLAAPAA
jgi:hypothetical protein